MAVIIGTSDSEVLDGTPEADRIEALEGFDNLYGFEGDDGSGAAAQELILNLNIANATFDYRDVYIV